MIMCGDEHYDSFEDLGYAILKSLPKTRQPVKWWKGWSVTPCHYENWMARTLWRKVKAWFPHFSKSRSWVGYFWLHMYLFNRWDVIFRCGLYELEDRTKE